MKRSSCEYNGIKDLLEEYTRWLNDCGYTDNDTWCEEPTAVDRFLIEELPTTENPIIKRLLERLNGQEC